MTRRAFRPPESAMFSPASSNGCGGTRWKSPRTCWRRRARRTTRRRPSSNRIGAPTFRSRKAMAPVPTGCPLQCVVRLAGGGSSAQHWRDRATSGRVRGHLPECWLLSADHRLPTSAPPAPAPGAVQREVRFTSSHALTLTDGSQGNYQARPAVTKRLHPRRLTRSPMTHTHGTT